MLSYWNNYPRDTWAIQCYHTETTTPGILEQLILMSPEDISENFDEAHHFVKSENFGESQLKMASPGLI